MPTVPFPTDALRSFGRRPLLRWSAGAALLSGCRALSSRASSRALALPDGVVIGPGDASYEVARAVYNTAVSVHPRGIAMARSTNDVVAAVRWAGDQGVELRARSGGHSYEGYSVVEQGLVVDVSGIHDVVYNPSTGEVDVGAGTRLLPLHEALAPYGVTLPTGSCATVGIAGSTMGGGFGLLSRHAGLTCDNLVEAEVVTADGAIVRASEREHADLFWALRGGGGGNFGIATRFRFRTIPADDVTSFSIGWNGPDARRRSEIVDAWQEWAPDADDRLSSYLIIAGDRIATGGLFAGPAAELAPLVEGMMSLAPSSGPSLATSSNIEAARTFAGVPTAEPYRPSSSPPGRGFKCSSAFAYRGIPAEGLEVLSRCFGGAPPGALVQLGAFGGAIARVAQDDTAFVHRSARFDLQYMSDFHDGDASACRAWVHRLRKAMLPYTRGAYVNYIDADIEDAAHAYHGDNLPRLRNVKRAYDPDNVFHFPDSIKPA